MAESITLRLFDDMHCHFRLNRLMEEVVPHTARYCGRAIAMPNTRPRPILHAKDVVWYRDQICKTARKAGFSDFQPLMTIEIRDYTTPSMVQEAFQAGTVAGKVYPLGVTTNSDEGLRNFYSTGITKTFEAMQNLGMLLLLHGELNLHQTLVTKREIVFLPILVNLAQKFPKLKIVLEHVSTKEAVATVKSLGPNVAATVTPQHCLCTLNDVVGDGIRPHNMCMPVPKDFSDRREILEAIFSGNPKFFLGSDTAPHPKEKKECAHGACGVFSAPILPQILTEIFEVAGQLRRLEHFTSLFGADFYGLESNKGKITLVRQEWMVPEMYGSVVPFMAGQKLQWQLAT